MDFDERKIDFSDIFTIQKLSNVLGVVFWILFWVAIGMITTWAALEYIIVPIFLAK